MNKLIGMVLVLFTVSACGLLWGEGSLDDKVVRMEAFYNASLQTVIAGRVPCVETINGEPNPEYDMALCYVDDNLYVAINKVQKKAKFALDQAALYSTAQDDETARTWLEEAENAITELKGLVLGIGARL